MKILAIRIKNLASLEGVNEIIFTEEPLCSAGIFAITGPTGAGKSTILDALCLALYAKTPRYRNAENGIDIADVQGSTIKQDDVRGILRDGTSDGYAEVDFVGVDALQYRATWSVRRARNRADGNLQSYDMMLKNISAHKDVPGKKSELLEEIERLVGLNFEQFTRSVLLAQGDFTAFLKAGKDEKSSLLEKLTGTQVYSEISMKIFENHREQQQKTRELKAQCEGIATLTTEELDALQEQKAALNTVILSHEQQIADLGKEILWHEQWSKLQEGVRAAQLQYEQANASKIEAEPRKKQLQQVDRIQTVRPIVDNLQNVQSLLLAKSKELEGLRGGLAVLKQEKTVLDVVIENTIDDLNTKIQEEEEARPLLNEAKTLDVQLLGKAEQLKQIVQETAAIRTKQNQQGEQLSETKKASNVLQEEILRLGQWKTENEARRPIAEQETIIISKLGDAESILENLRECTSRIQDAELQSEMLLQKKQGLESEAISCKKMLQQTQIDHDTLQLSLSNINLGSVEAEKSTLDTSVEDLVSAEGHWKVLYSAIKERDALDQSLESNKKELELHNGEFAEVERLLEIRKAERDISSKTLEKAKLRAAESVDNLRRQLEPNEPCPVCGSTTHPYAEQHYGLDLVLADLETGYRQMVLAYEQTLASHSSLNQSCIQLGRIIATQETEVLNKKAVVVELEETWTRFLIYDQCSELLLEKRADWLQQQIQQQKGRQKQLQTQIQFYGTQKQQLEAYGVSVAGYNKNLNNIENGIKDVDRALQSLQERKTKDVEEQRKANEKLDHVKQTLSVYLSAEQWFQKWQENPETFTKQIREFALRWKNNIGELEEKVLKQSVLAATLDGMEEQAAHIAGEVKRTEGKASELQQQCDGLAAQRKYIFDGKPVQSVEESLKEAVRATRQMVEYKKMEAEKLQEDITRNTAQNEQLTKDAAVLTKQEIGLKEELGKWLSTYNQQYEEKLTESELLPLLKVTQDWMEVERGLLRAIDDTVMQTKSIWEERSNALESHKQQCPSQRTLEELVVLQTEVQMVFKQDSQSSHDIDYKIKDDASNKKRIGHLLQDIERQSKVVDNWAKLNEIIGSADGKKFRQIAQEYTLDVLLSYANVHLGELSKRYVLQRIPNSLGLQVIDQDMGDEIRTVYSLSGGESFLVSLALALGLASLSSNRMKVESLFIDEGFGSLDPNTLNIAMDALERLHNQGRKVGVISHVQEMTERIPIQIKVSKQQSGRSRVEVVAV